jgi:hypothetical protein
MLFQSNVKTGHDGHVRNRIHCATFEKLDHLMAKLTTQIKNNAHSFVALAASALLVCS